MQKKFGFTLAEVLITLGIIGVVAAMTIPTLISNTNSAKFRSQFKKTVSTLNQAGLMAQAQYDIDYSTNTGTTACAANHNPQTNGQYTICGIFNGTLSGHTLTIGGTNPYGTGTAVPTVSTNPANQGYLSLADGSLVVFDSTAHGCTKGVTETIDSTWVTNHASCKGFIDVNGVTLPNREVNCNGSTTIATGTCAVANNANQMTDIYPIVFHDATVEPVTPASRYVLTTSK